jgi:prophage regulatory protein
MPNPDDAKVIRLLRLREVRERTGKAKSTIYQEIKEGTFPRPRRIGKRAVAWRENDINAYNESRPAA